MSYFLLAFWRAPAGAPARRRNSSKFSRHPSAEPKRAEPLPRRVAIRFLTDSDYPPFNYYDEDNVLTGFNVDIARSICLELAAACDIQVRAWQELLPALRRGEADAVIASHAVSANALKAVDFTDRYYHTPARFAASAPPAGSTSPPKASRARRSPSPRARRTRPICARSSATARSAPTSRPSLPAMRSSAARPSSCSTTASASPSGSTARAPRPAASSRAARSASPSTSATGWRWPSTGRTSSSSCSSIRPSGACARTAATRS